MMPSFQQDMVGTRRALIYLDSTYYPPTSVMTRGGGARSALLSPVSRSPALCAHRCERRGDTDPVDRVRARSPTRPAPQPGPQSRVSAIRRAHRRKTDITTKEPLSASEFRCAGWGLICFFFEEDQLPNDTPQAWQMHWRGRRSGHEDWLVTMSGHA